MEVAQVGDDVFLGSPRGCGADDESPAKAGLLAELSHDPAQARALFARLDLSRHADMVHGRHEHEEASGHRGVGRQAGALRTQGLLGHLDDDLLPLFEEILDLRLGPLVAISIASSALSRRTVATLAAG